jgi:hypothetical protein
MMEPLRTYINDHLGGAQIALQLLEAMRDQHDDPQFRQFAGTLLPEVQKDERTLRDLAASQGDTPSTVKVAGGWLIEKAARLKLGHTGGVSFELFESLELLSLGIQGKLGLWKALQIVSGLDPSLAGHDFQDLIRRAQQQYETVERARLGLAKKVFSPTPTN